jgi:hypothetical protein
VTRCRARSGSRLLPTTLTVRSPSTRAQPASPSSCCWVLTSIEPGNVPPGSHSAWRDGSSTGLSMGVSLGTCSGRDGEGGRSSTGGSSASSGEETSSGGSNAGT